MSESIASILERVKDTKITKSQRKLVEYMENADYKEIMYYTITEFAKATQTGEATVLRFCRLLGFDGYQVFKLQLARELSSKEIEIPEDRNDYRTNIVNAYQAACAICLRSVETEQLEEVADCILNARRVSCFGVGNSYLSALELHNRLLRLGIVSTCENDAHIQNVLVSSACENDVIIIFSVSGSTKDVVEAAAFAKHYGAKIILVTAHDVSPLSKISDIVISTGEPDFYRDYNILTNKVVQLYFIDSLCECLHRKDKDRFDAFIYRSRGATVGKLI